MSRSSSVSLMWTEVTAQYLKIYLSLYSFVHIAVNFSANVIVKVMVFLVLLVYRSHLIELIETLTYFIVCH